MKVKSSIKSLKNRKGCTVVSRRRNGKKRLFVINKDNPKFKAKQ